MRLFGRFFALFIAVSLSGKSGVSQTTVLTASGAHTPIGKLLETFEETATLRGIESVSRAAAFKPVQQEVPNFDFSNHATWLRLPFASLPEESQIAIENPSLDSIDAYLVRGSDITRIWSGGSAYPFGARTHPYSNFVFDLPSTPDRGALYLRIASNEQLRIPTFVGNRASIQTTENGRDLIAGIYFGIILAILVYNLFVGISTKDSIYIYYVLYILFIGLNLLTISGYAYRYLFPQNPWLNNQAYTGIAALSGIFGILFIMKFLQTKENASKHHWGLRLGIAGYVFVLISRGLGFDSISSRATDFVSLFAALVIYSAIVRLMRMGYRPANYLFIAWSVFLAGVVFFVLRNFGVLPYNNITNYTMQVGTALEVILLSFALADKINILKREKEVSQRIALDAAQENERLVREQNAELEAAVKSRTAQLVETNSSLQATLIDLKSAQTQLVEQEKMASLGQLTAGIAHEINNPINFVTSNINPIRRDLDEIFEIINNLQVTATAELSTEQRQKDTARLLADADYDYLKEEITTLLAGVQEGSTRTADIVKGLRLFSRLDENDLKYSDVNQGMDATLIIVNTLLSNKIELEKNYAQLPPIECYAGQLNQVWLNILTNAIHAIKSRHGDMPGGRIAVRSELADHSVLITIADNGTGMSEETKRKVFEPFFTTKEVGEGTGLGMSIVYNTIKKHNGDIRVESVVGEGTTFHITLPLMQPS